MAAASRQREDEAAMSKMQETDGLNGKNAEKASSAEVSMTHGERHFVKCLKIPKSIEIERIVEHGRTK
ncbi:hypothetical protein [Paenibacillus nanensis]|uniref:hypothetical protein n=1 Tax=Paenibacillus nanensis TaxID=393251 RepID=UPI0011C359C3|nr:hypothetical protein [Paenibacillus nanensis]